MGVAMLRPPRAGAAETETRTIGGVRRGRATTARLSRAALGAEFDGVTDGQ
jgi:hypothetical protein